MARLVRWLALQEKELDWINASKTLGSNPIKIIFSQMMPNLVDMAAGNIEDLCVRNTGEALLCAVDAKQRQA